MSARPDRDGPVRLLLLRDKKPGHYHRTEGMALALARKSAVMSERIDIRPCWWATSGVRRALLARPGIDPVVWLRRIYGIDVAALPPLDAVLGSGRPTVLAGILIARAREIPFMFSGRPEPREARDVALILASSPRDGGAPNAVHTLLPSTIDPDAYPLPRRLCDPAALRGAQAALLIGGPSYSHRYTEAEWRALAAFVEASAASLGLVWRVATSRRSPAWLASLFADLSGRGVIAEFLDYRTAGPGSAGRLFGADLIVVTEDSLSMTAEAVAARRPVAALRPAAVRMTTVNEVIAGLAGRGALAVMPMEGLNPERFAAMVCGLTPYKADFRDEIAEAMSATLAPGNDRKEAR